MPPDVEVDSEAVERILGGEFQRQGLMLSRFVLVTEQVDSDGRRSLNVTVNHDIRTWDVAGMLRFAAADCDAQMTSECKHGDEG